MLNNYDIFPVATGVFFATSDLHKPPALQPKELHHAGWWTSCRWAASIAIETWIPGLGLWVCKFGDGSGGIYLCILCDAFLYNFVVRSWEDREPLIRGKGQVPLPMEALEALVDERAFPEVPALQAAMRKKVRQECCSNTSVKFDCINAICSSWSLYIYIIH